MGGVCDHTNYFWYHVKEIGLLKALGGYAERYEKGLGALGRTLSCTESKHWHNNAISHSGIHTCTRKINVQFKLKFKLISKI